MRNGTPQIGATKRTLEMLEAVIGDGGRRSIAALARDIGLPVATAHRQVKTLMSAAYLSRLPNGRYVAGPRLLALLRQIDEKQMIANAAAPVLHRLAGQVRSIVQLGSLDNDMVTYRIKTGRGAGDLFTRVGMQLEAYCSAIGKVLLAHLPDAEREAYLETGPFVPLTHRTIVDPDLLRQELARVRERGYAIDNEEIAEGLVCVAMPLRGVDGSVVAAASVSRDSATARLQGFARVVELLGSAVVEIEQHSAAAGQM
ncbi:IclR family transcriptional regulator [Novosphingobium sp. KN65.2]|uniref:IclR family transcriptional regulator n=1 Tax=Novosphingobium sp. KN65.2 TaxID=1478134 RepID=UPI0005E0E291|nr:IclR family transcriptional regulator [Novosphingobium sp. KN65.2]CDO35264.1 Transcriptional regulator [Novosphingobium sp. KN65.2]